MPTIETIAKPRKNRISVRVPEEYGSWAFQVILVPIRPGDAPVPSEKSASRSLAEALFSRPGPADDDFPASAPSGDSPSFFERSGGFDSEAFA